MRGWQRQQLPGQAAVWLPVTPDCATFGQIINVCTRSSRITRLQAAHHQLRFPPRAPAGRSHAVAPVDDLVLVARNLKALAVLLHAHHRDVGEPLLACVKGRAPSKRGCGQLRRRATAAAAADRRRCSLETVGGLTPAYPRAETRPDSWLRLLVPSRQRLHCKASPRGVWRASGTLKAMV